MLTDKPHIQRAQPYDGDGWVCFARYTETHFGRTPQEAFENWRVSLTDSVRAGALSRRAAALSGDLTVR
jgi:hypothetical protein